MAVSAMKPSWASMAGGSRRLVSLAKRKVSVLAAVAPGLVAGATVGAAAAGAVVAAAAGAVVGAAGGRGGAWWVSEPPRLARWLGRQPGPWLARSQ